MCGQGHYGHAWTKNNNKYAEYSPFRVECCCLFFFLLLLIICVVSIIMFFNCSGDQTVTEKLIHSSSNPVDGVFETENRTTVPTVSDTTAFIASASVITSSSGTGSLLTTVEVTTIKEANTTIKEVKTSITDTITTSDKVDTTPTPELGSTEESTSSQTLQTITVNNSGGWIFPDRLKQDFAVEILKFKDEGFTKCAFLLLYIILSFVGILLVLLLWCLLILLC